MLLWPAIFMMVVALCSLFFILKPWVLEMFLKGRFLFNPMGITGALLAGLALLLLSEGVSILSRVGGQKPKHLQTKNPGETS